MILISERVIKMNSAKSLIDFSADSVTLKVIFSRSSWSDSSSEKSSEYSLIRPLDIFSSSSSFFSVFQACEYLVSISQWLKLCCYLDNGIVDNSVEHFDLIVLLRKWRWCGGISDHWCWSHCCAAGVSGVASRSFTTTRRSSKTSAGGERANVLLSVEIQYSKANNPSAQSAPCRLAPWGNCLTSPLVVTPLCKVVPNFAWFLAPNFWTCMIKFSQKSIMWQSFKVIGWGSSEILWRN